MGFPGQEYSSGLPFPSPEDLPDPGIEPGSLELQADALPSEPPGKSAKPGRHKYWVCALEPGSAYTEAALPESHAAQEKPLQQEAGTLQPTVAGAHCGLGESLCSDRDPAKRETAKAVHTIMGILPS